MGHAYVEHEIEVKCECGNALEADGSPDLIEVAPCKDCIAEAHKEGYDKGLDEAETD